MAFSDILGNNITFVSHSGKWNDVDQTGTCDLIVLQKEGRGKEG